MSASTPAPAPFPTLWRDTQAGRAERFHQETMRTMLTVKDGRVVKKEEGRATA